MGRVRLLETWRQTGKAPPPPSLVDEFGNPLVDGSGNPLTA